MATAFGQGGHSPTSLSRTLEKVLDEAQHTGEIQLSGRKLKDYPAVASKYDLVDTTSADLSKNRFTEIPREICEYRSLEQIKCYNNVIRMIPEALVQLQALVHLNLSRNQLTTLPPFIAQLQCLEVLHAANNKLVSVPEEISCLERLMDLDVSCNEITHLPVQIGALESLRTLNVRRNLLVELPVEISKLRLTKLDVSGNRISHLPSEYRKMDSVEEFRLDHNPLVCPPAHICTKGRVHIMKYLQKVALREDRKRGIMSDVEMRRPPRKTPPTIPPSNSDEFKYLDSPNERRKRHTVDSGYSTTDSNEKSRWSPSEVTSDIDEVNVLAMKAAEAAKEQRHEREAHFKRRNEARASHTPQPHSLQSTPYSTPSATPSSNHTPTSVSSTSNSVSPLVANHELSSSLGPGSSPHSVGADHESSRVSMSSNQSVESSSLGPSPSSSSLSSRQPESIGDDDAFVSQVDLVDEFTRVSVIDGASGAPSLGGAAGGPPPDGVVVSGCPAAAAWSEACTPSPELHRQKSEYEAKKQMAARLRREQEDEERERDERRRAALRVQESQKKLMEDARRAPGDASISNGKVKSSPTYNNYMDLKDLPPSGSAQTRRLGHSQSFREEKPMYANNNYRKAHSESSFHNDTEPNGSDHGQWRNNGIHDVSPVPAASSSPKLDHRVGVLPIAPSVGNHTLPPDEEFRLRHQAMIAQQRQEAQRIHRYLEEEKQQFNQGSLEEDKQRMKQLQKDAVFSYFSKRAQMQRPGSVDDEDGFSFSRDSTPNTSFNSSNMPANFRNKPALPPAVQKGLENMSSELSSMNPSFTIRRQFHQAQEENNMIDSLRQNIESRLKVTLPDDLPAALKDGVVLCHLANHIRPRSVSSIHVPSPAVPKLTMAKCRRNVENFLEACRRIGIDQEHLCACDDIVDELRPARVAKTVQQLVSFPRLTSRDHVISWTCLLIFCLAVLILYLCPLPE